MFEAGRCLMCMQGVSAAAIICPRCHTTTSYGKRRIAVRMLSAKLKKIALWFVSAGMIHPHFRRL
jgi:hypothetical protein